jgi:DNA-binding IclR family transcriptional regulator
VQSGRYALGPRALGMARRAGRHNYADVARPAMEALSRNTGETVFLLRRVSDHAVCIGREDPPTPVRFFLKMGSAVPLHEGASPKLLLAHMPPRARDGYLARHRHAPAGVRTQADPAGRVHVDEITPGVWAAVIVQNDEIVAPMPVAGLACRIGRGRQRSFEAKVRADAASVSAVISERQCRTRARRTA